jgi:hypothetical protein
MKRATLMLAALALLFGGVRQAKASLLTPAYQSQLESWLGEGPLILTNIYTKQAGDTSFDFHSAVDGQGRTFTLEPVRKVG